MINPEETHMDSDPEVERQREIESRRREIERTRAELTGSIGELGHRLSPSTLKQEAVEGVRNMAVEARTGFVETLKSNPLPTALVAGGLYFLLRNRRGAPQFDNGYAGSGRYASGHYETPGGGIRGAVDSALGGTRHTMDNLQGTASEVGDRVQDTAGQIGERVQATAGQAQHTAQDTLSRLQSAAHENPLGAAVVIAGIGALCGLLIPTTPQEQQAMGPAREQVMNQVADKAQEVAGKVQQVAQSAGEAAAGAAREEARNQDLPVQA